MLKIKCCNLEITGRIYNINDKSFLIVAECPECGQYIAEIRKRNNKGEYITSIRRTGVAAERLFQKYGYSKNNYKIHSGTLAKEYQFYNYYGMVTNGNGVRLINQNDFMKMSRFEINSLINNKR